MNLRVTSQNITAQAIKYSQSHGSTISRLQQQIATGRRINRPSDDPSITRALLSDKLAVSRVDVQVGNIEAARNRLNVSVSQLLSANELLVRAKDIALESPQEFDRALLADQVDVMLNELVNIANTQVDGEYLFSGTAIETQPFQLVRSADGSHVQYRGAQDRSQIVVGFELAVDVLFAGDEVFASTSRRPTEFLGQTGAQAGKGTDTASGRGQLVVRHGATSYDAGSGVVPSASSPTNDTIVGAAGAHKLTVNDLSGNGTSGVVTLNDGIAVPFSSADTDLEVVGPKGERVFIDMSAITAGFNGTVAITSTGTLSVDGGATEFPIDGSDNQQLVNSTTGKITHVDTTSLRFTGIEALEYPGSASAFQALIDLRDVLTDPTLSESEVASALSHRIGDLDRVREGVMKVVGKQSTTLESLDMIQERHEDIQLEMQRIVSDLESTDLAEAIVQLQSEQTMLQLTYATSLSLFDLSLLNFLR